MKKNKKKYNNYFKTIAGLGYATSALFGLSTVGILWALIKQGSIFQETAYGGVTTLLIAALLTWTLWIGANRLWDVNIPKKGDFKVSFLMIVGILFMVYALLIA